MPRVAARTHGVTKAKSSVRAVPAEQKTWFRAAVRWLPCATRPETPRCSPSHDSWHRSPGVPPASCLLTGSDGASRSAQQFPKQQPNRGEPAHQQGGSPGPSELARWRDGPPGSELPGFPGRGARTRQQTSAHSGKPSLFPAHQCQPGPWTRRRGLGRPASAPRRMERVCMPVRVRVRVRRGSRKQRLCNAPSDPASLASLNAGLAAALPAPGREGAEGLDHAAARPGF